MALPFLPGNTFTDPTQRKYHRSQSLGYKNGYALPARPEVGIGGEPLEVNQLTLSELDELNNKRPTLTYGQAKQAPPEDFIPAHVAFDKKVLKFNAFYKQTVHESPSEYYRVRPVIIYYYLEDDSISVIEPHIENSGMPQGKLIKRMRLPKNDQGDHWHWKDLNLDIQVTFYGKVFQITGCDKWTAEYMAMEGIELNAPAPTPADPHTESRKEKSAIEAFTTPSTFDKLKQFLELDRKVLRFFCVWDDRSSMFGEQRPYIIQYYLVDDTVEVREVHEPNDGRDPFPLFLKKQRVPKDRDNVDSSFRAVVMELSNHEIKNWYSPPDFGIGKTVYIYNRPFLIYDADAFTKQYMEQLGVSQSGPVQVSMEARKLAKMDLPPYNGFGSYEDSLQSCLSLVPQPPKKDFIKMLENDHKILRFEAVMDSVRPEDKGRRFIISYRLADDMIKIFEPPVRNSGIISGTFLERTRVTKPGSTPENPQFYGPQDLTIGSCLEVFSHRFIITDADDYVLHYLEAHKQDFPGCDKTIHSIQATRSMGLPSKPLTLASQKGAPMIVKRSPNDLKQLLAEVKSQLRKDNYINFTSLTEAFLRYDRDRSGNIDVNELKVACHKQNLPLDDDVMQALIEECGDEYGRISHAEFMKFLTWD
ncbi:EF-hand domain-containing protein 1-like [Lytechinus pictus]|uniref:EF-hand domain-containing protein 1-like n=1 Tax=Lytechinus pictus TaxID=7653 RepID=UPI0030B9D6FD